MDNVIHPKPPQWERKKQLDEDVPEDRVLHIVTQIMAVLHNEMDPTVVQLAALRLVQKGVITNYQVCMGTPDTHEVLRQATELAQHYTIQGPNGNEEA